MALLGIDVGTTGVKTLLIAEDGTVRGEATRAYPLHSPAPGWFEQDPEDWWTGTVQAIRQVLKDAGATVRDVRGIGLSGQYHGLVMLDRDGRVLRRSILWNDQRTARQSAFIVEKVGRERLRRICATGGAPYFTACKLQWVHDNEPAIYDRVSRIMLPKDYVRYRLTGECCTDVTDASGTLFLDVAKRRWSDEMPRLLGVPRDILPEVVESTAVSGVVSEEGRAESGLLPGTPVAGGGGDQACAAVGMGIVTEGAASFSIGTSGVIYAATAAPKVDAEGRFDTFCHAVPGMWSVLACINSAAGSHQWYQDKMAAWERAEAERRGTVIFAVLDELAAQAPLGSGKLLFLPYLAGERHPHTDTDARGVWFGLHAGHGREHLIRFGARGSGVLLSRLPRGHEEQRHPHARDPRHGGRRALAAVAGHHGQRHRARDPHHAGGLRSFLRCRAAGRCRRRGVRERRAGLRRDCGHRQRRSLRRREGGGVRQALRGVPVAVPRPSGQLPAARRGLTGSTEVRGSVPPCAARIARRAPPPSGAPPAPRPAGGAERPRGRVHSAALLC